MSRFIDTLMDTVPRRWDVLALGNPCVDIVFSVDSLPTSGEKVLGRPLGHFGGGTEANVTCAIAKLGRSVALLGRVGGDAAASELKTSLEKFGVCTEHLTIDASAPSACAITAIEPSGERSIVYLPMPNARVTHELNSVLSHARMLYVMPYDLETFLVASHTARQCGTLVAIDLEAAVAPDAAGMWRRIEPSNMVFFNESGFRAATGQAPDENSLRRVQHAGPKTVVVTLGAAGAMAVDGPHFARQPAFAAQVADTTGAGDTFNAAFMVAWMDQLTLPNMLRFACAAASCAVATIGARTGMPDRLAVEAVLTQCALQGAPGC
jgi:sugar/nucleoside kinase (ribokinase family)